MGCESVLLELTPGCYSIEVNRPGSLPVTNRELVIIADDVQNFELLQVPHFPYIDVGYLQITVHDVSFTMVQVQGATFTMGASPDNSEAYDFEKPNHQVTLSDYYIGQFAVTQKLWFSVMDTNPSTFKGENRPVETISWVDCKTFIQRLNQLTGYHFDLPTEAEWEFAARGGRYATGSDYPGSDTLDHVAWYSHNSEYHTHPVGLKKPNELGLYDMTGNVWEWCRDYYEEYYYNYSVQHNPLGPASGSRRVGRGGCYLNNQGYGYPFNRSGMPSGQRVPGLGLRLALYL